ncbi:MAG: VWA domain-containing protein, partial [Acidobacteria bacterium]|nr:VWA domain-containing protein [Acidobacteriota bacterium]
VALLFASTASVQQKGELLPAQVAPGTSTSRPEITDASADDDQVVVDTDLISFNVTVTDKSGRRVSGLPQTAFTIFDEKRAQEISFFGDDDSPISVAIVFDLSGSMTEEKVLRARDALVRFMETSHKDDEYYLITLQEGKALLSLDHTRDSQALIDKLTYGAPHGKTALYDACYLGLNKVLRGTHTRRALLLISDGQDNSSRYTFDELYSMARESDVTIYSIDVGETDNDDSTLYGEEVLTDLAAMTGGKFFHPGKAEEMSDVFERIALELRHQYAIGYRPENLATDGKWHRIKVKIDPPRGSTRLFLRYRSGYYAPANPRRARY